MYSFFKKGGITKTKMKYIIKGKGGQGVLFLARVAGEAILASGQDNFTFLKEFDEGQRNGEIKITFDIDLNSPDMELEIREPNMIELRKVVNDLKLDEKKVAEALKKIKPEAFERNLKIWQGTK